MYSLLTLARALLSFLLGVSFARGMGRACVLVPGCHSADAAVDAVGGVLRLLHAARLARVQRDINDALAAVQATTADAQTDNRLWGRGH